MVNNSVIVITLCVNLVFGSLFSSDNLNYEYKQANHHNTKPWRKLQFFSHQRIDYNSKDKNQVQQDGVQSYKDIEPTWTNQQQQQLNQDYMNYNRYTYFFPKSYQYKNQIGKRREQIFQFNSTCGECLRGGNQFCQQGSYTRCYQGQGPDLSDFQCSSDVTDDYWRYQMCSHDTSACGEQDVYLSQKGQISRNITNLDQGQTCNYRFYAECGAPSFKVSGNETSNFNITYTEWEQAAPENISKSWLGSYPQNSTMDSVISGNTTQVESNERASALKTALIRRLCHCLFRNQSNDALRSDVLAYYPDFKQQEESLNQTVPAQKAYCDKYSAERRMSDYELLLWQQNDGIMTNQLRPSDQLNNWNLKSVLDKAEPGKNQHFLYQIYSQADMDELESTDQNLLERYIRNPRKGLYSNGDGGYKGYNTNIQSAVGDVSRMERETDQYCSDRFQFVTVTSIMPKQSIDIEFAVKDFAPTVESGVKRALKAGLEGTNSGAKQLMMSCFMISLTLGAIF